MLASLPGAQGGEVNVYEIKVDASHAIVEFVLEGLVRLDEMNRFVAELQQATVSLRGRRIRIKADVRAMKPAAPEVAEMIRGVQEFGIKSGVERVAEIVESDTVALQLNRVARDSGTHKILRRFWDEDSARDWLIHGDAPNRGEAGMPSSTRNGSSSAPVSAKTTPSSPPVSSKAGRGER